jgi:DNA polymerase III epsilon subunit-like protein
MRSEDGFGEVRLMEFLLILGGIVWIIWFLSTKESTGVSKSAVVPKDRPSLPDNRPKEVTPAPSVKQNFTPAPAVVRRPSQAFVFCALDTETTGIVPRSRRHRAFEISCVKFTPTGEGKKYKKERFTRYIKVDVSGMKGLKLSPMWHDHSLMGGQKQAIEATVALDELRDFVKDLPLVCHNAAFDKCVIENELDKVTHRWRPINKWICTLQMARSKSLGVFVGYSPGRQDGISYKLEHVANALNLPLDASQLHFGHYDAEVAGTAFLKMRHVNSVPIRFIH